MATKSSTLRCEGDGHFDWVNLDQIYSVVMEEWPSMRDSTVLDGGALCERRNLIGSGLGFCKLLSYKRKGMAALEGC